MIKLKLKREPTVEELLSDYLDGLIVIDTDKRA